METQDPELKRLKDEQGALSATKTGQQKELETLRSDHQVLNDIAASKTFHQGPQPESGPQPQPGDAFAAAAAQDQVAKKEAQIEKKIGDIANTDTAIAANEKAQGDRKMEIETEKLEQKTNTVEAIVDKRAEAVDLISYHVDNMPTAVDAPNFDLGGTGKQLGEAAAYGVLLADHLKTVGIETPLKYEAQQLANKAATAVEYAEAKIGEAAGSLPSHVERENLEEEIAKHHVHADELDTLAQNFNKALDQPGPVDVSDEPKDVRVRDEFASVVDRANRLFEHQDKEIAELQVDSATDPAIAITEAKARKMMAEDTILKRDEVTRELCQPVAELNVDERNAKTLQNSAGLNKAHMERYEMKVANDPDGPQKVEKFASNLEQSQKELEQQLLDGRDKAIESEVYSLQGQHFPEVQAQAQALQGPGLQQSGPQVPAVQM